MVTELEGASVAPDVVARTVALVRRWVQEIRELDPDPAAARLQSVLQGEDGLRFALGLVDGVLRPESLSAAAGNLHRLAAEAPGALPWRVKSAVAVGGAIAPVLPTPTVPMSRRLLRDLVEHLFLDARPAKLGGALAKLGDAGLSVDVHLPGEAVAGDAAVAERIAGIQSAIARDDVKALSFSLPSVLGRGSAWAFADAVDDATERLLPVFLAAADTRTAITLDLEEQRDLDLTVAVLTRLLEDERLADVDAGIVLLSSLPDALPALQELTAWAATRVAGGGMPIRVRIVKGAGIGSERVRATLRGWTPAPYDSKDDTDAAHLRLIDWALRPEHTAAVRVGVGGHDLYDLAYAWTLASDRDVTGSLRLEMLLGMSPAVATVVLREAGQLTLSAPAIDPRHLDRATGYLARRLAEGSASDGAMARTARLVASDDDDVEEDAAFERTLARAGDADLPVGPRTRQDRTIAPDAALDGRVLRGPSAGDDGLTQEVMGIAAAAASTDTSPMVRDDGLLFGGTPFVETAVFQTHEAGRAMGAAGFRNTADTDPSSHANRAWAREVLAAVGTGPDPEAVVTDVDGVADALATVRSAAESWGITPALDRSDVLRHVAVAIEAARGDLIARAASAGVLLSDADAEVSAAVDAAGYVASTCRELDAVSGAVFVPAAVTVVFPRGAEPIAGTADLLLSALAAGSGVVLAPDAAALPAAAALRSVVVGGGVPERLIALADPTDPAVRAALVAGADRLHVAADRAEALRLRAERPDAPLLAETPGVVTTIVTGSADLDLAAVDLVASAFGRAGQDAGSSSVAILVGSVGRSKRFATQLVDAVRSVVTADVQDPRAAVGPLAADPDAVTLAALRELAPGETWLVQPEELGPRLWSPGIRTGVSGVDGFAGGRPNAPVLGIVAVATFGEALRAQAALGSSFAAGLYSQDPAELEAWLDATSAGSLFVNRPSTGAIVQRQPRGGWEAASLGGPYKSGGPNRLLRLGSWRASGGSASSTLHLRGLDSRVTTLVEAAQPDMDYESFDWVRRGALSDAVAWDREYGRVQDVSGLRVERNLLRYRRVPVAIRGTEGASLAHVLRTVLAAIRAGSEVTVSRPNGIPSAVRRALGEQSVPVFVETDEEWLARVTTSGVSRARVFGTDAADVTAALAVATPEIAVFSDEVTTAGRLELLPFLREQSISITAHRFGMASPWSASVI